MATTTQSGVEVRRKVVLVGFRGVGKSSLAKQFTEGKFEREDQYLPTIEQTFRKAVSLQGVNFDLDVVDTAGMDEYSTFSRQASVGVHGYLFVFSVASQSSLEKLRKVHENLINLIGHTQVPMVLVGQKSDLTSREVSEQEATKQAQLWSCPYIEVSAKMNHNVVETFHELIRQIEKDSTLLDAPPPKSKCAIL